MREWRTIRSGHLSEPTKLWYSGVQSIRKGFLECGRRCLSVVKIGGRWRCSWWSLGTGIRPTAQISGGSVQPLECRVIACLCQELQTDCRLTLPFGSAESGEEEIKWSQNLQFNWKSINNKRSNWK